MSRFIKTPDLTGLGTRFVGVELCDVGEEGAVIALGHIEPRRFLTAVRRHARDFWGLGPSVDGELGIESLEDALARVKHDRAVFTAGQDCEWYCHWNRPRGVPITRWTL